MNAGLNFSMSKAQAIDKGRKDEFFWFLTYFWDVKIYHNLSDSHNFSDYHNFLANCIAKLIVNLNKLINYFRKLEQSENAESPIDVTLVGIVIDCKFF